MSKKCVPKETKDINVKVFKITTNKNEAKTMAKHISCNCKRKFNGTTCNSNQKWNNNKCQCECKKYYKCKKDYSLKTNTGICENSNYLKSIADTSEIAFDKTISVMNIVSTKMTNTTVTNIAIYCQTKKP